MRKSSDQDVASSPDLRASIGVWAKIGVLSFGGPAGQIALMHKIVVEEKRWLNEDQFLAALNFCMLLPGPEAMQLATYVGWRKRGVMGGLIAGLLFVLPGAFIILALAIMYASFAQVAFVQSLFLGIKAAVIVIVIEALIKVSKRALLSAEHYLLALVAFIGVFSLAIPFPVIILAAVFYGYFRKPVHTVMDTVPSPVNISIAATFKTIFVWVLIWLAPFIFLFLWAGDEIFSELAAFFSKLAVVTFGGAYAVLAYMAQDVVQENGWLTAAEMVDGLGLAETTPGPLILVTEFVGFLAAEKVGGLWAGVAGALVTLWVTFVPCFLWIFTGAPYLEWVSGQPGLKGALSAVTAAVVGVILNLSLWFAMHVYFLETQSFQIGLFSFLSPDWASIDGAVVMLSVLSGVLLFGLRWNLLWVLAFSALGGVVVSGF